MMASAIGHQVSWLSSSKRLIQIGDEAHVWRAYLNQEPSRMQYFLDMLSPDERQKAGRYRFPKDREHFVIARGALRDILSRYLDISPHQIQFSYNRYGKPGLVEEVDVTPLCFNVSHAHEIALYAITRGREVGIDIERIREDFASLDVAERFFSPREISILRELPPSRRTTAFFHCWTRKEAYIKALGEGLSRPLRQFTVSLIPGEPVSLWATDTQEEVPDWSLTELPVESNYAAALAVKGKAPFLRFWHWSRKTDEVGPGLMA